MIQILLSLAMSATATAGTLENQPVISSPVIQPKVEMVSTKETAETTEKVIGEAISFSQADIAYTLSLNESNTDKPLSGVSINPVSDIQAPYNFKGYIKVSKTDTHYVLEAISGEGYEFVRFINSSNPIPVKIGTPFTITAEFRKL